MRGFKKFFVVIFLLLFVVSGSWASGRINSSNGLLRVNAAWVLPPRHLTFFSHTDFFGKAVEVDETTAKAFWQVNVLANFTYGLNQHFEIGVSPIVYQDNHKSGKGYNLPSDLYVNIKAGNYGSKASSITFGILGQMRFPTGTDHNLAFEPYSAPTFGWGFTGLLSYSLDPLYPEDEFNAHLNLGYFNHNDVGERLTQLPTEEDSIFVKATTQEFLYGFGIRLPGRQVDYGLEFFGNAFLQAPPVTAYSRENYLYISPSITYRPNRWCTFVFSFDYRLTSDKDETEYELLTPGPFAGKDMPNYPTWKINAGIKLQLLPTSVYRVDERDILMQKAESRRELFEQIIRERRQTESAEEELERIKDERRKAERELERLRKILEDQARRRQELERLKDQLPEPKKEDEEPPPQE